MKLIGVTGNSGAGKSTFSSMLGEHEDVGVIYVDNIVGNLKKKYFGLVLQPKENNTTEQTKASPKIKTGVKKFFYSNRVIFGIFKRFRSMLVQKGINEQISEYRKQGKKMVVIDDWLLTTHKKLYPQLDKVYVLSRKYTDRRKGLTLRDSATREELNVADIPYALEFVKKASGANVIEISNRGTIEDLRKMANLEYDEIREKTFDERYAVPASELTPLRSAVKTVEKAKELGQRTRIEE